MSDIAITIQFEGGRRADLQVPDSVPTGMLLPEILSALGMKGTQGLLVHMGRILENKETLADAEVRTGCILKLGNATDRIPGITGELRLPSGRRVPLHPYGRSGVSLGRFTVPGPGCIDLSIEPEGDTVSRVHARLKWSGGNWRLEVCSTANRSYLNEQPLDPGMARVLRSGDRIRLGLVDLIYN